LRFGKRVTVICLIAAAAIAARGDLARWVQHQPSRALLDQLLRSMPLPGGAVRLHRPPSETRPALTKLIAAEPRNAALYQLRAHEAEMQLDFAAAENDWRAFADLAADRGAGYLALADFYHARVRAADEIRALETVGSLPSDPFLPATEQRAWQAYERMFPVIRDAGLPVATASTAYRNWIARYPKEPEPLREFIAFLAEQKQYAEADAQIRAYAKAFPDDGVFPVEARANLAAKRDSEDAALRVYDQAFQPLWPKPLLDAYFALLDKNSQLREFLARARAAREKNPGDINAAGRLFAYYQHANNMIAARRVLLDYRLAKEAQAGSWTPLELRTLAGLFERLPDANEEARAWYALYSIPSATAEDRENALAGMIALLLKKPEEPIRFGSGDLSLYKDIATADSSPGFLNGILSLVLNSTLPPWKYEEQNNRASAYFHRAEGAQLLELLEKQFPASPHRTSLRASLVDAYAGYGDDDGVVLAGRAFLTAFPRAPERTHVALTLADALARRGRTQEEFAVYQQMLAELASRAGGVPLGVHGGAESTQGPGARSADYVLVLNQYLARLSALKQPMEALRVYRREIDRNPNDPGLYERFAAFLEQNKLGADVQDIYRRAIAKFPDKSWYHKLARWYLREEQQTEFTAISREVTGIFSGAELESYFSKLVVNGNLGPQLYLQLNEYAHQRFPQDLAFVHNLLHAYQANGTYNPAAETALLHDYWFYDDGLKRRYFEKLSMNDQLLDQMGEVRREHPEIQNGQWQQLASANPAAAQFHAEAEAWLGHYEAAAPALSAIASLYPGSIEWNERASSIYRSLAAYVPADTEIAVNFAQKAYDANPRETKRLETVGDIYSDKDQFTRAAISWNTIPKIFPGKPDGYLEAATVYWDYYRFDDALRMIRQARVKYAEPALFAYEAGAIEEGRRDDSRAVAEYLAGAAKGNEPARGRIVRLASRPAQRDLIYRLTANADTELRIDVLKAQQRRAELGAFLAKEIAVSTQVAGMTPLIDAAREQGFESVERQGLEREIAVTLDPVERMRLRIELVKYFEARKDLAAATLAMDALYRDNPLILGVIRARVDFDRRNNRDADAITALTEAAVKARPDLSAQLRFEAARIATTAGRIDQARALLTDLLRADPYHAGYIAQMAETYAAAKDDAGFIRFATAEIDALKKSALPPVDRKDRIAALRRRLIVTLARRDDYAGAIDQYIEVINQYPEDQTIAREAALFAAAHQRQDQLTSFYSKTIAAAPRDWRWPIVLARIETALEDYPAALNAYGTAMKARPDRADLVQARAELEERLLLFDDAIKSYSRLYQLTYNDPQWLDKAAEFQARLGRGKEAVATLERAHIGAGGESVTALFEIARKLDEWHLAADAARYAERGFKLAGAEISTKYPAEMSVYSKIMAETRNTSAVVALKTTNPLIDAGKRIANLYTPEEKSALVAKLTAAPLQPAATARRFAESAGLEEHLAQLLYRDWMSGSRTSSSAWIALQSRRGRYEQLSRDLEAFASGAGAAQPASTLQQAAVAAEHAGDTAAELRIDSRLQAIGLLPAANGNRYLALLLEQNPRAVVQLAGSAAQINNRAVQVSIASGKEPLAMDALRARSRGLPPVWLTAYTALTGDYFDDHSPAVNQAFVTTLHPVTIGQRLASKPDTTRSIVGSTWFYYGARFGEYLTRAKSAEAADYLASALERNPGDPEMYLALGQFYLNANQPANAIMEFRKTLDLDSDRGEAHDDIARALMQQGRRDAAISEWRDAITAFEREQSRGVRVRETFWALVSMTIRDIAGAKVFLELQPDIHHLLADYVHRNGGYRTYELFPAALEASFQANAGFEWLQDVLLQSDGGWGFVPGLNPADEERLFRFRLRYDLQQAATANGYERTNWQERAISQRISLISLLLTHGKVPEALAEWKQFAPAEVESQRRDFVTLEMRLAGANGTMEQLIARFRAKPAAAPAMYDLRSASTILRKDGHVPAALALLEFGYTRELDEQHLGIANFLGLARVYLERGDPLPATLAILRRMTLVAGAPFEAFEPAGDLLIEFHHEGQAREFLAKAVQATPWNSPAKLKLARVSNVAERNRLATEVINDPTAAYAKRAEAAKLIARARLPIGGELALLASGNISADAANRAFYVESRLVVGTLGSLREALAVEPDDRRVRLAVIRAALAAQKDSLALAMYRAQRRGSDRDLLEALSRAAEHTGDLAGAIGYLNEALRTGPSDADRQRIERQRDVIQAEQKLRKKNADRQPVITNKLEQTRIVQARESR
jgi:Flp pilus assembly protein TadD